MTAPIALVELEITALAAGGDGLGRDDGGRVTFVPRTAPGDRARVRIIHATSSFARGELVELIREAPGRVSPPCRHFTAGCGGCAWQHVARADQLAAKQAILTGALRKLDGLTLHPIADPAPALGWRRRARFHVAGGRAGLYALGTRRVVPIDRCPQLEPALDLAYVAVAAASPPDGELALLLGHTGAIAVGVERPWKLAEKVVGRAGIVGVIAGGVSYGAPIVELEPGLANGPWDFAQASAAGNAALVEQVRAAAAGTRRGRLLELHAGAGNFTRALVADGWDVIASDVERAAHPPAELEVGSAAAVLARVTGPFEVVVLDPPRTGAADTVAGILALAPPAIIYVSCDPATLARDAGSFVAGGYRATDAWPIDLMPQTAQVEIVLRLVRA